MEIILVTVGLVTMGLVATMMAGIFALYAKNQD